MVHKMGLYGEYFQSIIEGKKKVEVRLNDEKRRKIKVGDTIEFIKVPQQDETLKVQVTGIRKYETFKEMYENIPFKDFDCEGWTMKEMIDGTYEIYTPEQEKEWGALAITIKYLLKFLDKLPAVCCRRDGFIFRE
jgi:ASC-1-like (ASCH) protein